MGKGRDAISTRLLRAGIAIACMLARTAAPAAQRLPARRVDVTVNVAF